MDLGPSEARGTWEDIKLAGEAEGVFKDRSSQVCVMFQTATSTCPNITVFKPSC
jgi:hypothetical protein